jgi:outer membrane receptor protein involved in Fe transport
VFWVSAAVPSEVIASVPSVRCELSVVRLSLDSALIVLGRQCGLQIAGLSDPDMSRLSGGPLSGHYTTEEALGLLLHGTGLTFRFLNDHTVAIVREGSPNAQKADEGASLLPTTNSSDIDVATRDANKSQGSGSMSENKSRNAVAGDTPARPTVWSWIAGLFGHQAKGGQEVAPRISPRASRLAAACAVVAAGGVCAQAATPPASASGDPELQEVVVTGSRVITNGNESPTPVTVVSIQQMTDVKPSTVAEQLNELPQFANSQTENSGIGNGSANGGNPNGNANVLNLRNMGSIRNLILYDGHRVSADAANGTVDINTIPQLLLQRVDVVTGGTSAVYGADAVTGVVNFITDTKFQGFKANLQGGMTAKNDGKNWDAAVAWGTNVGANGHFEASYEYRKDEGIDPKSSREWGADRWAWGPIGGAKTVNGITTQQVGFITHSARRDEGFLGVITDGDKPNPYDHMYFATPGVLVPMTGGTVLNANNQENGSGLYFDPSLRGALRMHQLFARYDYDLTDHAHYYIRGAYTNNLNSAYGITNNNYIPSNNDTKVFVSNPYLPAVYAAGMMAAGLGPMDNFTISRNYAGPGMDQYRNLINAYGRNWSVDTGFNGSLGNWKWELSYIHSDSNQRVVQEYGVDGLKEAASMDAVVDGGTIKCWVNTAAGQAALAASPNAAALKSFYAPCVPQSSLFAATPITPAEAGWLFDPLQVITQIRQDDVEAFISGSPFNTWAGAVQAALSGEARRQSYEVTSSNPPATLANPLDCTGLRLPGVCGPGSLEYSQSASYPRPLTSVSVREAALETDIPLLKDARLVKELSLTAAVRDTDYSTSGSIWSWKGGLHWQVTDDLSLRGTRSRDIRAPTLNELYAPQQISTYQGQDQLLGKNLRTPLTPAGTITSGNTNLLPELGDTVTIGAVYSPSWVSGLSVAVDYYDIKVQNAIVNLAGTNAQTQLDCIASGGSSPSCALIVRPIDCCTTTTNANAVTTFYSTPVNYGQQFTHGVDIELNYSNRLFGRAINLRLLDSYQPTNTTVDGVTKIKTNNAGVTAAKTRASFIASMEVFDGFRATVEERYRGALNWVPQTTDSAFSHATRYVLTDGPPDVPSRMYTALNLSYRTGPTEIYFNVQNLFNTQPAVYAAFPGGGPPGLGVVAPGDDPIGRTYTVGARLRL